MSSGALVWLVLLIYFTYHNAPKVRLCHCMYHVIF